MAHFDHRTLVKLLRVCRGWLRLIDPCETVWRPSCEYLWADKTYVPRAIRALAEVGNDYSTRLDLQALSLSELQTRAKAGVFTRTRVTEIMSMSKEDLITSIKALEKEQPLYPGEPLSKRALRQSVEDSSRRLMDEEEIMSFEWYVRIRRNGPLGQLAVLDPWWSNAGFGGRASFTKDPSAVVPRSVQFMWPPGRDPFEIFNMNRDRQLAWMIAGNLVKIYVGGEWGHFQNVARHPVNWGWLLVNSGTVWTSWPMPAMGEDVLIEDEYVNDLVPEGADSHYSSDDDEPDEDLHDDDDDDDDDNGRESEEEVIEEAD